MKNLVLKKKLIDISMLSKNVPDDKINFEFDIQG